MTNEEFEKFLVPLQLKNGYTGGLISNRHFFEVDDGWISLVANLIDELIDAGWNKEVNQVKEKFGGLRFYINEGASPLNDIIATYESLSFKTCEFCGNPGKCRNDLGWTLTLCQKHYNEEKEG